MTFKETRNWVKIREGKTLNSPFKLPTGVKMYASRALKPIRVVPREKLLVPKGDLGAFIFL